MARWFAEAVAAGHDDLARRIVGLLTVLREREADVSPGLSALLDEMDRGETTHREHGRGSEARIEDIAGAVDELLDVLKVARLWPPRRRTEEVGIPYGAAAGSGDGPAGSPGARPPWTAAWPDLRGARLSSASYRGLSRKR